MGPLFLQNIIIIICQRQIHLRKYYPCNVRVCRNKTRWKVFPLILLLKIEFKHKKCHVIAVGYLFCLRGFNTHTHTPRRSILRKMRCWFSVNVLRTFFVSPVSWVRSRTDKHWIHNELPICSVNLLIQLTRLFLLYLFS